MTIEQINKLCQGTFIGHLNIEFTGYSESHIEAVMKITPKHYQPEGFVHGGALISLAETVGSAGSILLVDPEKFQVFGSIVNSQHLNPVRKGMLHAYARLIVRADFKHIWDVEIKDESQKLISISRVTNSVKPKTDKADQPR